MDAPLRWLIVEGLVPMFGAGLLYALWGVASYINDDGRRPFTFGWREALDPLGWLYVSLILALQTAERSWNLAPLVLVARVSMACAMLILIILLNAMAKRSQPVRWRAPMTLIFISIMLAAVVLALGYWTQGVAMEWRSS
ncbi:MAG: hypothetical protein V4463_03965 [Pseudomonadota bacterium]